MSESLLDIRDLSISYGPIRAISGLTLSLREGEVVALLGANGAGKSSLLRCLAGLEKPASGTAAFRGDDLMRMPQSERVKRGLVLVPEGRQILVTMTIEENLLLGATQRADRDAVHGEIEELYRRFPNLASRRELAALCLSGGEQQMLAIGRAILAKPKLLMLDEPSLGLSPVFVDELFDYLAVLSASGISMLLVEQNTRKSLTLADRGYILKLGSVMTSGPARELLEHDDIEAAYLGS